MYITLAINATLEKQPQGFNFRKCYKSDILKATQITKIRITAGPVGFR